MSSADASPHKRTLDTSARCGRRIGKASSKLKVPWKTQTDRNAFVLKSVSVIPVFSITQKLIYESKDLKH